MTELQIKLKSFSFYEAKRQEALGAKFSSALNS